MRKLAFVFLLLLGFSGLVHANAVQIEAGKALVEQGAPCTALNEAQMEQIGEYYMELRHPGQAHEWMDAMMGGEGSESLRLAHVRMGQVFYCGQGPSGSDRQWMMPMMGFDTQAGTNYANGMMGAWDKPGAMMGNYYDAAYGWNINGTLLTLFLLGAVIAVFLLAVRLWRDVQPRRGRKHG